MKILRVNKGQFVKIEEDILDKGLSCIDEVLDELPEDAIPSEEELKLIKEIDEKLIEFEDRCLKRDGCLSPATFYKNWSCINSVYNDGNGIEELRHCYIEYNADEEFCITAMFMIDFTNNKYRVELQECGEALPNLYDEYDNIEDAITILREYIYNASDYSDYE